MRPVRRDGRGGTTCTWSLPASRAATSPYCHRFLSGEGYLDPPIFEHGGDCRAEKYTFFLDSGSDRLYLFNNQGVLITFDTITGERLP